MTIRDDARQEAERRYPIRLPYNRDFEIRDREQKAFEAGAVWASEQTDREPSDAEQRLADVIEYTERQMGPPAADWEHDPAKILQTVARFARGEDFPDFSERG